MVSVCFVEEIDIFENNQHDAYVNMLKSFLHGVGLTPWPNIIGNISLNIISWHMPVAFRQIIYHGEKKNK